MSTKEKTSAHKRRKNRVNTILKNSSIPYRCVANKSNTYTSCQIIDTVWKIFVMKSDKGMTGKTKKDRALELGKEVAKIAIEKWITQIAFDRNGYLYHGRIASLCEWLREWWLTV